MSAVTVGQGEAALEPYPSPISIESITLREIRLPLREPFRISSGVVSDRRILLIELRADGRVGWSECVAGELPNYSAETIDTAWFALQSWLARRLVGQPVGSPDEVRGRLEAGVRGHRMAKAALEMGVWELWSQREGVSLSRRLGGTRERVEVGVSLGIQPAPAALVERALDAVRQGYRKVKLKIAPGADYTFVAAVREAVGADVPLMVDANCAYRPSDVDALLRLDDLGLTMIEQPFEPEDLVRHAWLQKRLRTALCLDESITSAERADDMIALASARIVNIKPGRVGGFGASKAIHDLCATRAVPVWCGGMLESGIGRAHNVALASLPNFRLPGDLSPSARYWERDIVMPEWTMSAAGHVRVPVDRPGMGVDVDLDRVDDLTVRHETIGPGRGS